MAVRAFNPTRAEHGYEPGGSVLETNTEDLPFLVDSVSAELGARGLGIVRVLHPIVGTERSADGGIARILHPSGAPATESVMHFELDRRLAPEDLADLEDAVRSVLADVRRVVRDFPQLRERVESVVEVAREGAARYEEDEVAEVVAFLEWLARDNFIFLGARDYELVDGALRVVPGSGLGLLDDEARSAYAKPVAVETLDPSLRERALGGELLLVSKTNRLSPVHRRVRMDYVGIRRVSSDGEIVGEARMIGLFTTKAYAEPASETPVLHRKLQRILASEDLIVGSHDYKAAVSLFESFPKDELFAAPTDDLRGAVVALMGLQAEQGRVLGRRDADGRTASIIVALPKGGYDAALLERLRAFLRRRFDASTVDAHEVLDRGRPRARALHHPPRPGRPARALAPRRRGRDPRARAHVGRPRPRRARRAPRRGARAHAGQALDRAPARLLQGGRRPGRGGRRHRPLRAPVHRAARPSTSGCATSPTGSRASGCTAWATRSSSPRPCRRSSTSACAWSRSAPRGCWAATAPCGCRTSACSARPTSRSTSRSAASASRSASPRSGAARRSRTR